MLVCLFVCCSFCLLAGARSVSSFNTSIDKVGLKYFLVNTNTKRKGARDKKVRTGKIPGVILLNLVFFLFSLECFCNLSGMPGKYKLGEEIVSV